MLIKTFLLQSAGRFNTILSFSTCMADQCFRYFGKLWQVGGIATAARCSEAAQTRRPAATDTVGRTEAVCRRDVHFRTGNGRKRTRISLTWQDRFGIRVIKWTTGKEKDHMTARQLFAVGMLALSFGAFTEASWGGEVFPHATIVATSGGGPIDNMGTSVAISGLRAIAGAPKSSVMGANSGAAFAFVRGSSGWTQTQLIKATDGQAGDAFGTSVAMFGNVAVIGAYLDDDRGTDSGSAYVFRFNTTTGLWVQEQKLLPTVTGGNQFFGWAVAIDGDTILIGAFGDSQGGSYIGAAYFFKYNPTSASWTQLARVRSSDAAPVDFFGCSVGLSNGMALIGARCDDDRGTNSGSVYVFKRNSDAWIEQQKLTASDGATDDQFGLSLAVSGNTAVIGSRFDDDMGNDSGSAYIFAFNGSSWTQQQKLTASDGHASDAFSKSVAICNDTVVVGAEGADYGWVANAGAAYVFQRTGSAWSEVAKLRREIVADNDNLGHGVAVCGNIVLGGALGYDGPLPPNGNGMNSGAMFAREIGTVGTCDADVNGNGAVEIDDLFSVVRAWGMCPQPPASCPADVTRNGYVNLDDLNAVINAWGACP
jgi:hypothetical protein